MGFFGSIFKKKKAENFGNTGELDKQKNEPVLPEPPPLYMRISFATNKGRVRKSNQDFFYVDGKFRHFEDRSEADSYIEMSSATHVYAVFDGMGGEAFGNKAAKISAEQMELCAEKLRTCEPQELGGFMDTFVNSANKAICDMTRERGCDLSGSTFVAVVTKDGFAYPFYIGDSRAYVCDRHGLFRLTDDQTLAFMKLQNGEYNEVQAKKSPDSHKLTCFLGIDREEKGLNAQMCRRIKLRDGLKLVLCSDGLTDMCSEREITRVLKRPSANPALELLKKALGNGGLDNVTCIVAEVRNSLRF